MSTSSVKNIRIIHEVSSRIRVYCAALHDPALDPAYLEAVIRSVAGVLQVRINIRASCIIVSYDGDTATKKKILSFIENIPEEVYQSESLCRQPTDIATVLYTWQPWI